jgi:hypothetical protein
MNMKKLLIALIVVLGLSITGFASAASYSSCYLSESAATTSVVALASTTSSVSNPSRMVCQVEKGGSFNYGMVGTASSITSKLNWTVDLSWDETCSVSGSCLWFADDNTSVNSNESITHSASNPVHDWTPAATTTQTKVPQFTPTGARWVRINYWVTGGDMNLWAVGLTRHEF